MRGHRHSDWIGACGGLKRGPDEASTHFYIHTLAAGSDGKLHLLAPERVEIATEAGTKR
jgi:hypothetical protein